MRAEATPGPELHPALASCPLCRDRWERAADLYERTLMRSDEEGSVEAETMYAPLLSPFGIVWLAYGPCGVRRVETNVDELTFRHDLERAGVPTRYAPSRLRGVVQQFADYFAGQRAVFDLPIDLSDTTPFRRAVLQAVAAIPWGEVRSYGEVAFAAGKPGAARAVGTTMATNPLSIIVPCHRVIRGDGTPGEYGYRSLGACGTALKRAMLAAEGIAFRGIAGHGSEAEQAGTFAPV